MVEDMSARFPMGLSMAILATAALLTNSCADEAPRTRSTEPPSATSPGRSVSPLDDEAAINDLLRSVGLKIDRPVSLPGSESVAFIIRVPGDSAIETWASARDLVTQTGRYPVIVGGPVEYGSGLTSEFEQTLESAEYLVQAGVTTESVLADASAIDTDRWFQSRTDSLEITAADLAASAPLPEYDYPKDEFITGTDILTGAPRADIEVALLPTANGWEAPAYLLWGGWNDVPQPDELVAIFKRWSTFYGADVVSMTGDVVEMKVTSPPTEDATAIALAREHFLVAPDNVWQGTGDLATLAAAVLDAPVWYFWWD